MKALRPVLLATTLGGSMVATALTAAAQAAPVSPETSGDCAATSSGAYGSGGDLFALTADQRLLRLSPGAPGSPRARVAITGLAPGERLVGIDTRPANGQLYALGNTGRLHVVDPASGAVSPLGTLATPLDGEAFGVDWNPTVDRLRIISNTGQNLRVNPNVDPAQPGVLPTTVDGSLAYAAGDPSAAAGPSVVGAAYANNTAGATSTTLYDLDVRSDVLVVQAPPNAGTLATVGPLGVNVGRVLGVDISASGTAYAAMAPTGSGTSTLYTLDLTTGKATSKGRIAGGPIVGLTAASGPARTVFATTEDDVLVRFDRSAPGQVDEVGPITGLQPGEHVVGMDFRPATGGLYAVGSTSRLYLVNPSTAAATAVGEPFTPRLAATDHGVDFNPTVDRLRVISELNQNLRVNPDTGAVGAVDGGLAYPAGDAAAGRDPNGSGAAYTNNVAGASTTVLYDIEARANVLVTQAPPNAGTLNTVGPLQGNVTELGGFDISADGVALASIQRSDGAGSSLACIDLSSGRATSVGSIGTAGPVRSLAVAPRGAYFL